MVCLIYKLKSAQQVIDATALTHIENIHVFIYLPIDSFNICSASTMKKGLWEALIKMSLLNNTRMRKS